MLFENVLVVDDEEALRHLLGSYLSAMGYRCQKAASSSEAMERLAEQHFDLVISDLRMKGADGIELMKEAKAIYPHLSFVIMTGFVADYKYQDIIAAGAVDYIGKPFEMGELKARLERIEREKRTLKQLEQTNDELKEAYAKLGRTLQQTVNALGSAIEMRDPYTAGHQQRVANLACAIAREMGMSGDVVDGIQVAGLIHDIGKVSIPAEILAKPGPLTRLELQIIEQHPNVGYEILKNVEFPWPIATIVYQHHERIDGSGYPVGLAEKHILLEAKILAVADVVETMATHRPYRAALGMDLALKEIVECRGSRYDPEVVEACVRLIEKKEFKIEFTKQTVDLEVFV